MGEIFYFARRCDQAIEQLQKTLDMDPNYLPTRLKLGRAYEQKRMYEEAIAEFQKARTLSADGADALASLAHAYASSGMKVEAQNILAQLKETSKQRYVSPYDIAMIHAGLDEKDQAFEWLDKAYEDHAEWMIYLTVDPRLDSLRAESRYSDLARRVGLAQ